MSLPDLITPVDTALAKLKYGELHQFSVSAAAGFRGIEIEHLLRKYGIRIWDRQSDEDNFTFLVKRSQAQWAEYILCRAGMPLTCSLLDARNEAYRNRHASGTMPTPWQKRGLSPNGLIDHVVDWLDRLLG